MAEELVSECEEIADRADRADRECVDGLNFFPSMERPEATKRPEALKRLEAIAPAFEFVAHNNQCDHNECVAALGSNLLMRPTADATEDLMVSDNMDP